MKISVIGAGDLPYIFYPGCLLKSEGLEYITTLDLQFIPEEKPDIDAIIKKQQSPETSVERFERLTGTNPCLGMQNRTDG